LGGQADVAHHRDAAAHQPVDHGQGFGFGALELHGCGGGFLQHPAGGGHGLIGAALVAEEGQIADQQRFLAGGAAAGQAPGGGAGVVQHLVEGHRQGCGMAQHRHGQGIAHQHRIGSGLGHQRAGQGIPGCQHGDGQSGLFAARQVSGAQGHWRRGGGCHC